MASILSRVRLWGAQQSQHAIRSAVIFLPILLIVGAPIAGVAVVMLQLSSLMPRPDTLTLKTLVGATVLFGATIAAILTSAHVWVRWLGQPGLGFIGLDCGARYFVAGILWGTGLQAICFAVLVASTWLRIDSISLDSQAIINVSIITISSLNAGLAEEVLFRGVLYSALRPRWGWWATALATSALFALPHLIFNSYEFPVSAALGLLTGGVLFAWARELTGGLGIPIGLHFAWDAAIGWLNLTGRRSPHLLMTTLNAPAWVAGEWGACDWILLFVFAASLCAFRFKARSEG